jgi:hypothetical protein
MAKGLERYHTEAYQDFMRNHLSGHQGKADLAVAHYKDDPKLCVLEIDVHARTEYAQRLAWNQALCVCLVRHAALCVRVRHAMLLTSFLGKRKRALKLISSLCGRRHFCMRYLNTLCRQTNFLHFGRQKVHFEKQARLACALRAI